MAKLDRKDVKIFAENSKETLITEFRTEDSEGNTASFSRDPDVIQNENYSQGWVNDTNNLNTKIYGEDLNAVNYVLSYLLKYLYENGIAEWKSTTTYYQNSICKVDNALYLSLQNNNTGNDPTSTVSYWKLIPLENVSIDNSGSGFSIVKDVTDNVITFKTISVTGYGEITDNGDQLNIDIAGGGGGGSGDAYWGTIRGTITNQTDLMALINLKQDIFTVDAPLVLTDDHKLTINKATSNASGYLDYNDFNTFNGKQNPLSFNTPLSESLGTVSITKADTSTSGYLDYQDWNTFNNKQDALSFSSPLSKTSNTISISKADSSTSGYLSSTDWKKFYDKYHSTNTGLNMFHTTDTTTIRPIVEAGYTNSYIGTSSYPFTNGYITDLTAFNLNIKNSIVPADVADIGTSTKRINKIYATSIDVSNNVVSASQPLSISKNALSIRQATSSQSGYLSSSDWTTFNNKVSSTSDCAKLASVNTFTSNNIFSGDIYIRKTDKTDVVLQNNGSHPRFDYTLDGQGYACTATKTAWNFASDRRLKKNIINIQDGLGVINDLKPVKYDFKKDPNDNSYYSGFIAQDVMEVIPDAVENDYDGYYTLNMTAIIPYLTKSIQELNAKVESLEARIAELEGNKGEEK